MRNTLLSLALSLSSLPAMAGDWHSGGGEVLLDSQNPWFIQSTTTVDVCLIWDQSHFHPVDQTIEGLKARFDATIAYWKRELAKAQVIKHLVSVGTQDFRVVETALVGNGRVPSATCEAADLKVQFGYLSTEQIAWFDLHMGGVQKYLASTVRTSYEPVTMKGRGFIYLKPDSGPLSANSPRITPNPWNLGDGYLINYALLHELGHLFGIPHKGLESIMAVDFLERAFDVDAAEANSHYLIDNGFFAWGRHESIRQNDGVSAKRSGWKRFLGLTNDDPLYIDFEGDKIAFYSQNDQGRTLHGTLAVDPAKVTFMPEEAVRVYLPEGQLVIDASQIEGSGAGYGPWLLGPMVKNEEFSGTFVSADGKTKRQMLLTLSPQALGFASSRFSVEIDGEWFFNLDWVR